MFRHAIQKSNPQIGSTLFMLLLSLHLFGNDFEPGKIYGSVTCAQESEYSYSLYLPTSYSTSKKHPLVLIFEPMSRSTLPLEKMQAAADQFGYVLVCSRDTRNFNGYPANFKAAKAMWQDAATRFSIDRDRTYTAGFSGGARLGSEVAIVTKSIAGHMACGAGFRNTTHANKKLPFPVALAIGNKDMNFMELTDLERKLGFTKTDRRFFIFDGGHQWPGSEEFINMFQWFELLAMRQEKLPKNKKFVKSLWKADMKQAETWEREKNYVHAQRLFQRMVSDYEGLVNTQAAQKKADKLRQSEDYKIALQRKTRLENAEKMRQRRYIKDLRAQGEELPEDLADFSGLMRPWLQEKQRQDQHIKRTKNDDERLMAERLNDFAWRMCTERAQLLYGRKKYREALFLNLVVTTYVPKFPFSFVETAKCYAQLGANDQAMFFLTRASALGINHPEQIANDPAFLRLMGRSKFQKMFMKQP